MIWYLIGATVWVTASVTFWYRVLYPILTDSTFYTAFGMLWTAITILFAVCIMIMGHIAEQGRK